MSFLLKIVEGPNKGAQIALVEGVAVTLGKSDDCDIVLADPSMREKPVKIEASEAGVAMDGEMLNPFEVKILGETSFAVGPAEGAWGELVWPKKIEVVKPEEEKSAKEEPSPAQETAPAGEDAKAEESDAVEPKKRRGGLGCIVIVIILLALISVIGWFCLGRMREASESHSLFGGGDVVSQVAEIVEEVTLSTIAGKYGLSYSEDGDVPLISGNLKTRRERLAATAEAYDKRPGVELDLTDDESFRASAEAALFSLTEGTLKVAAATNRVLSVSGYVSSPAVIEKVIRSLNEDLPKLKDVDVSGVVISRRPVANVSSDIVPVVETQDGAEEPAAAPLEVVNEPEGPKPPTLPVCGILTVPYPCLVLRDGRRLLEGATVEDSVIMKIEADSVTLTNSMGRFVWKP